MIRHQQKSELAAAFDRLTADLHKQFPNHDPKQISQRVAQVAAQLASQATVTGYLPILTERAVRAELAQTGRLPTDAEVDSTQA
jgi:hypothetical protein